MKFDATASDFMKNKPTIRGQEIPLQYASAMSFIALDDGSPWCSYCWCCLITKSKWNFLCGSRGRQLFPLSDYLISDRAQFDM